MGRMSTQNNYVGSDRMMFRISPKTNYLLEGLRIRKFKHLGENVRFGGRSRFDYSANIEIGDDSFIGRECYFSAISRISIGSGVMIGPRVMCVAGSHCYDAADLSALPYDDRQIDLPIIIEDNVWIGGNVSIAPGTHIGEGSVVAMGAVVCGDIPPLSVVVGEKGTILKSRDSAIYQTLKDGGQIYSKKYAGAPFRLVERH